MRSAAPSCPWRACSRARRRWWATWLAWKSASRWDSGTMPDMLQVTMNPGQAEVCAPMHRFYFDIDDGDQVIRDNEGLVFDDLATACREAVKALPDVAHDVLPDGVEKLISASVRDAAGSILFRAVLAFRCEWPQPDG